MPSSKPRANPMQSVERRRCNQKEIPVKFMRDWQAEKGGVRWGESRNGCPPPAGKFAHDEKLVHIAGYSSSFAYQVSHIHASDTAFFE